LNSPHAFVLAAFALIVTTVVSVTHCATREQISKNQILDTQRQLSSVLPANTFDNRLFENATTIVDINNKQTRTIYIAKLQNKPTAVVITANAPDGYVGDIDMLVGIYRNGSIAGARVTQHRETPGLGDKIEYRRSDWITDFNGKNMSHPLTWAVKKDNGAFDQITGATITSRSVVRAIRDTLLFFDENSHAIFPDL